VSIISGMGIGSPGPPIPTGCADAAAAENIKTIRAMAAGRNVSTRIVGAPPRGVFTN
jgi:hypothetical protein